MPYFYQLFVKKMGGGSVWPRILGSEMATGLAKVFSERLLAPLLLSVGVAWGAKMADFDGNKQPFDGFCVALMSTYAHGLKHLSFLHDRKSFTKILAGRLEL